MPHIHRIDMGGAAREQDLGEAAGGGPDVEADPALRVDLEGIEGGCELEAAAGHVRVRLLGGDDGLLRHRIGRLADHSRRSR